MRCKVCSEEHRVLSDGNDVPRYVRAACKCERRDVCGAKRDCVEKVVGVTLEPDGKTTDTLVCLAHVPPGFDDDDFKLPFDMVSIAVELPPLLNHFGPTPVTCAICGHAHLDSERFLFFSIAKSGEHVGKMLHRTACPKCRGVLMNAV